MSQPRINFINRFEHVAGSEMRTLHLARLLAPHAQVKVWATAPPNPDLLDLWPIEQIDWRRGHFPKSGTFVFVGVYYYVGNWVRLTRPSRRIIIFNTPHPQFFDQFERHTAQTLTLRAVPCEIVYACEEMRSLLSRPGHIQASPIDIGKFTPVPKAPRLPTDPFVAGRFSRDDPEKFHEDDAALFRTLADNGLDVRLMGGRCLGLAPHPRTAVTEPGSMAPTDFLHGLDCFVYRTRTTFFDTFARVVFEAMACGLPTVLGGVGGYAAYIRHGFNGFLFDTIDEARARALELRDNPALAEAIGAEARRTVEELYSEAFRSEVVDFYTSGTAVAAI